MKKNVFLSFIFLFFGFAYTAVSQEVLQLSLVEAQVYATEHNKTMQKADLAIQKAEYAKWQSISSLLPKIDASATYTNYLGYKMPLFGQSIEMNPSGNLTAQVGVGFSGMQVVAIQLSEIAKQMSQTSALSDELTLKANVTNSYCGILVAEKSKKLLQGNLENLKKLYESSVNMVKVGMAEQTDADQLEVQVGMIENSIRMAERNVELSYNTMRLLLGVGLNAGISLDNTLDDFSGKMEANELLATSLDVSQNYTLQMLQSAADMNKKQVAINQWAYAPTVSAFYQYTKKTNFDKPAGFDMTPPNLVGVTVSVPIFSGGERYAKVKQAQLEWQTANLTKEQTQDALLTEEKQLRFNLTSAIESYELQQKNIALSERIFANATQKYELGMISSTELTSVSNNTLAAQNQYIGALMDMLMAKTKLQQLVNKL